VLLLLIFLVAASLLCSAIHPSAVAQETEEDRQEDWSLQALLATKERERRQLRQDFREDEERTPVVAAAIRQLNKEIELLQQAQRIEIQLEQAKDGNDNDRIERLGNFLENVVDELEQSQHLGKVEASLRELRFELREARQAGNQQAIQHLTDVIKHQQELVAMVKQLYAFDDRGPEEIKEVLAAGVEISERLVFVKQVLFELQTERIKHPEVVTPEQLKWIVGLLRMQEEFLATGTQLLASYENGATARIEPLEEQFEAMAARLEPRWKIFELETELRELREEGNRGLADELERELIVLRGERHVAPADSKSKTMRKPVRVTTADMAAAAKLNFQRDVYPILKARCMRCHGRETHEADLDLEKAAAELPFVRNRRLWINVAEQTKTRRMPPKGEESPNDAERRRIAAWLQNEIENFDYRQVRNPGYEPARRLTHQEYSNTVRDLFGMPLLVTDKFPADLSGTSGFDNSANTLFIQPLLLERYMAAADEVVRQALPTVITTPQQQRTHQRIFTVSLDDESSEARAAEKILSRFLSRAYRRPVMKHELRDALRQFETTRRAGLEFEMAIKSIVRASLISPKFLMKIETSRFDDNSYPINDWELATRLSYFLWASMPDEELFRLATDSELSDGHALTAQVDRMLADPKADTLGTIFASQWLGFQHLGTRVRADPIDNPWCTDSLMDAMKAESAMFFTSLIRKNNPLQQLVKANYTYLNEELARHYDLPGVRGSEMRRVRLGTANRGGIFTQGSLLAVTSFPGRTSPVLRGKWILDNVLGTPPPPPPPNVSEFTDEIEDRRGLTHRQKLELHRDNPNCYSCHRQIDPLGFSLANYDWFGRFKERADGRPIDARGRLPDGSTFSGPAGLKGVIIDKRMNDLTRQISRKMLSYAVGRQLEYYDELAVRKIILAVEKDGYRLRTLIHKVVQSYPFRYKQHPQHN